MLRRLSNNCFMVWSVCIKQKRLLRVCFLTLMTGTVGMGAVSAVLADVAGAFGVLASLFGILMGARHCINYRQQNYVNKIRRQRELTHLSNLFLRLTR